MWTTGLIVIAVLVAGVLVVAALRPGDFAVQRSAAIRAAPDRIYPLLADIRQWLAWRRGRSSTPP
jgi:hypothetical protein